jgi:hypothetical protein
MGNYRPITDSWILARSKVPYYGAYPSGFLQRARDLIGVGAGAVLHVCSGRVRKYPFAGLGRHDLTMDLDRRLRPDIIGDARHASDYVRVIHRFGAVEGVLADPPYSELDATHYRTGAGVLPSPGVIVANALQILPVGGRVGVLSLMWPRYPKAIARQVAVVAVYVGNGNAGRTFAVYERIR